MFGGELVPGCAGCLDHTVIVAEYPVREIGLADVLPDVLGRVQLWAGGRQMHQADVGRHLQLARGVPAGLVEGEHGVGTDRDTATDLVEVMLHGTGIGARKHQRGAEVACWADRAEHIGVSVTLIFGLARTRPLLGPLIDEAILLPDPHFVLEPDLDRQSRRYLLAGNRLRRPFRKVFLKPR